MSRLTQVGFYKFTHESASARLTVWDNGLGEVSGVYSRVKGKGHATQVMQEIIECADKQDLLLQLIASSYGPSSNNSLSNDQLLVFYSKFGFVVVPASGAPFLMERYPK